MAITFKIASVYLQLLWYKARKHDVNLKGAVYEIMMSLASCGTAVELGQRAGQW